MAHQKDHVMRQTPFEIIRSFSNLFEAYQNNSSVASNLCHLSDSGSTFGMMRMGRREIAPISAATCTEQRPWELHFYRSKKPRGKDWSAIEALRFSRS